LAGAEEEMSDTLYREFKIDTSNVTALTNTLRVFWVNAVMPFVAKGKRVMMIVTSDDVSRNAEQNKRLWGYTYKHIAEQAWVSGKQFAPDVWHEMFCRMFWACDDVTLPDGEIVSRRKSTTKMTVKEFAQYMNEVESYAASELGVMFPA
jgi:hypothetical protein